jgi:hypothetical protein
MNLVAAILLLLLFRGTPAQTLVKAGEITDNPQRLVLSRTDSPDQGIAQFDCSHCSAMNDLFFVAVASECGNAGCSFYVFQKIDGKSYKYVTNIFLNHGAFQFLKTMHHGRNDIVFYHHMSAFEGELGRYEFDGKDSLEVGETETIKNSDFKSRITPEPVVQIYRSKEEVERAGS